MTQAAVMLAALRHGPVTALALNRAGVGRPNSRAADLRRKVRAEGLTVTCTIDGRANGAARYLYQLVPLGDAVPEPCDPSHPLPGDRDVAAATGTASPSGPRVADQGKTSSAHVAPGEGPCRAHSTGPLLVRPARSTSRGDTIDGTNASCPRGDAATVAHADPTGRRAIPLGQLTLDQPA